MPRRSSRASPCSPTRSRSCSPRFPERAHARFRSRGARPPFGMTRLAFALVVMTACFEEGTPLPASANGPPTVVSGEETVDAGVTPPPIGFDGGFVPDAFGRGDAHIFLDSASVPLDAFQRP